MKKDEIYTVIDIADEIGVSRPPVSGAIKILESEVYVASANAYYNNVYGLVDLPQVKKLLKDHTFLHENWYKSAVDYCPRKIEILVKDHNMILEALGNNDLNQLNYIIKNHEEHCFEALKEVLLKGGIS